MDAALRPDGSSMGTVEKAVVSILVLVDAALRRVTVRWNEVSECVSILVLVDAALRHGRV